jgi:hypothetical protein
MVLIVLFYHWIFIFITAYVIESFIKVRKRGVVRATSACGNNTTSATSGKGTTYRFGSSEFTPFLMGFR